MANEFYTDEILNQNFEHLRRYLQNNDMDVEVLFQRLRLVEDQMSKVMEQGAKATKIVVKAKGRSKFITLGVIAGAAYLGYKMAETKFEASFQGPNYKDKKPANVKPAETEKED